MYKAIVFLTGGLRRQKLSVELERLLEYSEDSNVHVKKSLIMNLLALTTDDKSILTRSIKEIFHMQQKNHSR